MQKFETIKFVELGNRKLKLKFFDYSVWKDNRRGVKRLKFVYPLHNSSLLQLCLGSTGLQKLQISRRPYLGGTGGFPIP